MDITGKEMQEEIEKLTSENNAIRRQLVNALETINSIRAGNIDALVVTNKKDVKVYTEKTSDKIYRILIEKMHEGAVTINADGTILYCNSFFANLVHLPLQRVISTKFKDYIDSSSMAQFNSLFEEGWEHHVQSEILLLSKNKKSKSVLVSVHSLTQDETPILSIIITDLTIHNKNKEELKKRSIQLEEKNKELEDANKDLTTFTYISSHDLQEPLRKIQTFVSLIMKEEEQKLSSVATDYFTRLREAAKRMQTLIEDLLTYSHTKNSDRKFEIADLKAIVKEITNDLEDMTSSRNATIEVTGFYEINIIKSQFIQLVQNLLSNSFKFSKPEMPLNILIRCEIKKGNQLNNHKLLLDTEYSHIIYTDNGIGFAPQYNNRIFEVFQRLNSKEEYKGTGMGLAICKRIAENHNGFITASGELNKGARFDIYIPVLHSI